MPVNARGADKGHRSKIADALCCCHAVIVSRWREHSKPSAFDRGGVLRRATGFLENKFVSLRVIGGGSRGSEHSSTTWSSGNRAAFVKRIGLRLLGSNVGALNLFGRTHAEPCCSLSVLRKGIPPPTISIAKFQFSSPDHLAPLAHGSHRAGRAASKRNQVRRSASSIQTSSRLAVATSPCSSHRPCVSRMRAARCLLSSRSSASISIDVT